MPLAPSKKEREAIRQMYDCKCSYCGVELNGKWHVDHFEPVHRTKRYVRDDENNRIRGKNNTYLTETIMQYPERDVLENMVPACIKCNNDKSSSTIEDWRRIIKSRIKTLNESPKYASYQKAKRFGLVQELDVEVTFWFERYANREQ